MVKLILKILGGLLLVFVLAVFAGFAYRAWRQHQSAPDLAITTPNGIDERLFILVGGIEQFITIRGQDRRNPIILFVHGGPAENHSYFPAVYRAWEKDFTIVQWDQRGSGRTYGRNPKPPADLNLAQMTKDGIEVAARIAQHLGQEKMILVGHSWGTILGEHMVFARPGLFSAYVGTGQFVAWDRLVRTQYAYALGRAKAEADTKTSAALEKIGPPPYADLGKYLAFRRTTSAGIAQPDRKFIERMRGLMLLGARISLADIWNEQQGMGATFAALGPALMTNDLTALGYDFPVPFFVIQGADDRLTPTSLALAYFQRIQAPKKAFFIIENAGHFAAMTEPIKFLGILDEAVRPIATATTGGNSGTTP